MVQGFYYDQQFGGCLRRIYQHNDDLVVKGAYGIDQEPHTPGTPWYGTVTLNGKAIILQYRNKKNKTHGLWCEHDRMIRWEDGNTWYQMYAPYSAK